MNFPIGLSHLIENVREMFGAVEDGLIECGLEFNFGENLSGKFYGENQHQSKQRRQENKQNNNLSSVI